MVGYGEADATVSVHQQRGAFKYLAYGALAALGGIGLSKAATLVADRWADRAVRIITQDPYEENLFEAVSQFRRIGLQRVMEIDLRATSGGMFLRPLGSPKAMPNFQGLMFNLAQLGPLPTAHDHSVNTKVTLGPQAERPLTIDLPVLIAGMGYGVFMSKAAKIAIAKGANQAGTATNTGEGPFLAQEREAANRLVVQYHRGNWMNMESLQHADAVEIHIGQGASGSVGSRLPKQKVTPQLKKEMGLGPDDEVQMSSTFSELSSGRGLAPLVERSRRLSRGAPIFVKFAASHRIEHDLDICFDAGADGVVIDGAQAGTGQSPPIAQDDFGIPTLFALVRARKHLDRIDPRHRMSLIVAGGLVTPGDFLKCLALGADAVYVGSAVMLAVMAGQQQKSTPGEPPTQVIAYQGNRQRGFDIEKGAKNLACYLDACRLEMEYAARLLGKDDVRDVTRADLCALDDETAHITGVEVAYDAPQQSETPESPPVLAGRRR